MRRPSIDPDMLTTRLRRAAAVQPSRTTLIRLLGLLAGVGLGLALALPLADISGRCPPSGQGLAQCELQKQILPALVKFLLAFAVMRYLAEALIADIPAAIRRRRAGGPWRDPDKRKRDLIAETNPDWESDPVLVAASWG